MRSPNAFLSAPFGFRARGCEPLLPLPHRPRRRNLSMTAACVQPALQLTRTLPLAPSETLRLGFVSLCAGHRAFHPSPLFIPSRACAISLAEGRCPASAGPLYEL